MLFHIKQCGRAINKHFGTIGAVVGLMARLKWIYMNNKLLKWFKSPYPLMYGDKSDYVQIVLTSIFISIFIYVLQPFGLSTLPAQTLVLFIVKVASAAMLVSIIVTQVLPKYLLNEDLWQIWKQASLILLNFSAIALVLQYLVLEDIKFITLLSYLAFTILIAIGPLCIRLLITQNKLLKENLAQAKLVNDALETNNIQRVENEIKLNADDGESLYFLEQQFIYAKAEKNYVEIFCQDRRKTTTNVLRMPFSTLIQQLNKSELDMTHCHRSYLVNLQKITKIIGNSRGYSLELNRGEFLIPVSRSKAKQVLDDVNV